MGDGGTQTRKEGRLSMALVPRLDFIKTAPVLLVSHVGVDLEKNIKTMFEN